MKKQIPEFKFEDSEREFWAKHDSTGFIDWDAAEPREFTQLKVHVADQIAPPARFDD